MKRNAEETTDKKSYKSLADPRTRFVCTRGHELAISAPMNGELCCCCFFERRTEDRRCFLELRTEDRRCFLELRTEDRTRNTSCIPYREIAVAARTSNAHWEEATESPLQCIQLHDISAYSDTSCMTASTHAFHWCMQPYAILFSSHLWVVE